MQAGCFKHRNIYFKPFTTEELQNWKDKSPNDFPIPENIPLIPLILSTMVSTPEESIEEVSSRLLRSIIRDQFGRLEMRMKANSIETSTTLSHLHAAFHSKASLTVRDWDTLLDEGLIYRVNDNYTVVYPRIFILQELGHQVTALYPLVAEFAKGAAYELCVHFAMQTIPHSAKKGDGSDEIIIPRATEMRFQSELELDWASNCCTIVKLSIDHKSLDFIIVDDTGGFGNTILFLVQVSVQNYNKRSTEKRYTSVVNNKITKRESVLTYYANKARVPQKTCTLFTYLQFTPNNMQVRQ